MNASTPNFRTEAEGPSYILVTQSPRSDRGLINDNTYSSGIKHASNSLSFDSRNANDFLEDDFDVQSKRVGR